VTILYTFFFSYFTSTETSSVFLSLFYILRDKHMCLLSS